MILRTKAPTVDDLVSLLALEPHEAQHRLDSDAHFVCAYEKDILVGAIWYVGDGVDWVTLGVQIRPESRRKGIATKIRLKALQEMEDRTMGEGRTYGFIPQGNREFWDKSLNDGRHYDVFRGDTGVRKLKGKL